MTDKQISRLAVVKTAETQIVAITKTKQTKESKIGQIAEPLHCMFFNLDAINKEESVMAYCDKDPESPVSRNDPLYDILIVDKNDGKQLSSAQLKYHSKATITGANVCRGDPSTRGLKYAAVGQVIVPEEQLTEIQKKLQKKILKEEYKSQTDPNYARHRVLNDCKKIQASLTDFLNYGGVHSESLTMEQLNSFLDSKNAIRNVYQPVLRKNFEEICGFYEEEFLSRIHSSYGVLEMAGGFVADVFENQLAPKNSNIASIVGIAANTTLQSVLQLSINRNIDKHELLGHIFLNFSDSCINTFCKSPRAKTLNIAAHEAAHLLVKFTSNSRKKNSQITARISYNSRSEK